MNSFHPRNLASLFVLLISASGCHSEPTRVAKLVSQLNGNGCDFDVVYDSATHKEQCKLSPVGFGEWATKATAELECGCRGRAARCLTLLAEESRAATPDLVKYLSDGPSDVDNGDGGSSCLSNVLTALGEIGEGEAVVSSLTGYLKHPRRVYQLSSSSESGRYAGLSAAIATLVKLKPPGEEVVTTFRELLSSSDPELKALRPVLIQSLQRLGDEHSISEAINELGKFDLFLNAPVTRQQNVLTVQDSGFKSVVISLESLKDWSLKLPLVREEREKSPVFKKLFAAKPQLESILSRFDSVVPKWINDNLTVPKSQQLYVYNAPTPEELERIRRNIIILLAKIGEPSVLVKLLEVIQDIPRDSQPVELLLSYGDRLDELVPQITTLAEDLQFQDKPLSETLDGSKYQRASILIETLLRRATPAANVALERLEQNEYLRKVVTRLRKRVVVK